MRTLSKLSLIAAAALTSATAFADLTDVHPSAYTTRSTWTYGVSSDGLTSVGYSAAPGNTRAFKLTGSSVTTLLPLGGHVASVANAASNDGSLVVGFSVDGNSYNQAVSWTGATATVLDINADFVTSEATGVSVSGGITTIVGWGFSVANGYEEAFFHRSGSITSLGSVFNSGFGSISSKATGVSSDGNTIVGTLTDSFSIPNVAFGFVYVIGTGMTLVDAASTVAAFNNAGLAFTQLTAISGDGTNAIGYASSSFSLGDEQAFKYNLAGASYTVLGTLGGGWSKAHAISNDGSVIVGESDYQAFKYQNGTMTGLGFLTGGSVSNATGVSADGSVIVGHSNLAGGATHSFVYANQTMLDADEWLRSLNGPGSLVAMSTNLNLLPLEGAHHRPLMSYDSMGKQSQAWATGDFGTSARQIDQHKTSGEIGVSSTFGGFVVGVAAGHASLNQDLLFGGNAHISGNYLLAEADYRLADKESILSLVLLRGDWDAEANRGYETGGGTDVSNGRTDLTTSSVRLRLDGPAQKFVNAVSATPFASFTLTRTTADAYTETTGSFPASFGDQAHTAQEGRLGLTAKYAASPSTTLLFTAEWIHRFDDAGDGLTATSSTMGTLTAAGIAPTADQARFGFEVDHKLSADTLLNVSVHAAGNGPSSDFAGAISIRRAF
jgi:probable HAF family extracellular repeat protein